MPGAPSQERDVLIIGGGLAGLSLAAQLVGEGLSVTVLEENPYLGGRASSVTDPEREDPVPIAPHIFVTAYNNLRDFFQKIGAEDAIYWERDTFIDVVYDGQHHDLSMPALPRPLHLAGMISLHPLLTLRQKLQCLRLGLKVYRMPRERCEALDDITAKEYLLSEGIPEDVIDRLFQLFSKSLLNLPVDEASAAEMVLLWKDWMALDPGDRRFGFAKGGLGDIYTGDAASYIRQNGGEIRTNATVTDILIEDGSVDGVVVAEDGEEDQLDADTYVSTVTPVALRGILPDDTLETEFFEHLEAFEPVPYISVFLWFDEKITDRKFWALLDTGDDRWLNTDFYDKSNLSAIDEDVSYITSNIIFSEEYEDMSDEEIIDHTLDEIRQAFPEMAAEVVHAHVHHVPYGVYAPYPGMREHKRPQETPIDNFYLAGDWTIREIPQCMEAAVRSGYRCAETVLAEHGIDRDIYEPRPR